MRLLFALLLLTSFATAQTASKPAQLPSSPAPSSQKQTASKEAPDVSPTAAVITIHDFCPGKQATGPACNTTISREQFEKLADALHVPPNSKPQLANAYAQVLVLGGKAEERGIASNPSDQAILSFVRLQTLAQLLARDLRAQAANVPPAEVQAYYDQHKDQFEVATLQRIFIPKSPANAKDKPDAAAVKAEADKISAAAKASGADFSKLQKQAYDDLKITTMPPPVDLKDEHRDAVPPSQQKVFELAPGAVSDLIEEPAAFYLYKLVSKQSVPLTQVEAEVKRTLEQQRFQAEMEKIVSSVKPELNPDYFGPPTPVGGPSSLNGSAVPPGAPAASNRTTSAPKNSSNPPKPK